MLQTRNAACLEVCLELYPVYTIAGSDTGVICSMHYVAMQANLLGPSQQHWQA